MRIKKYSNFLIILCAIILIIGFIFISKDETIAIICIASAVASFLNIILPLKLISLDIEEIQETTKSNYNMLRKFEDKYLREDKPSALFKDKIKDK